MEIKIGISDVPREVTLETDNAPEDIVAKVRVALDTGTLLDLTDSKGRRVIVPAGRIAYVDLGSPTTRAVGFGAV